MGTKRPPTQGADAGPIGGLLQLTHLAPEDVTVC